MGRRSAAGHRQRLVLGRFRGQDPGVDRPSGHRLVAHRRRRQAAAGQPRGRRGRALPGRPQQLLQRRHQVARRRLLPREALHLRGQRTAPRLRPLARPHHRPVITTTTTTTTNNNNNKTRPKKNKQTNKQTKKSKKTRKNTKKPQKNETTKKT